MKHRFRWIAVAGLAAVSLAATVPAQAHTDLAIGLTLGAPGYAYAPPPPRYYESTVVYEEPRVVYEEPVYYETRPRVVYERRYCPPRRVYRERVYYRHHHHDWDD